MNTTNRTKSHRSLLLGIGAGFVGLFVFFNVVGLTTSELTGIGACYLLVGVSMYLLLFPATKTPNRH